MSIEEFIEARMAEKEYEASPSYFIRSYLDDSGDSPKNEELATVAAFREILELHKQWPMLVQKPATMEVSVFDDYDPKNLQNNYLTSFTQEIAWMTRERYVEKFGLEAPTTPILAAIARIWKDHPDYDSNWG